MIWYGYHSVIAETKINYKILCEGMYGSNKYEINFSDKIKLPKSHVVLHLQYNTDNFYKRSIQLKNIVNDYFNTPFVNDFKISNEGLYTGLSKKDCELSLPEPHLKKLQLYVDNGNFTINKKKEKKYIKGFSECATKFIGVPYKTNNLQIEYVAKCSFIHVAYYNVYLRSQVGRINWFSLNNVGTIIVPSFEQNDNKYYNFAILNLEDQLFHLQNPEDSWKPGYIRLSNNYWYLISDKIKYDYNFDLLNQKKVILSFLEKLTPQIKNVNISIWKYDNIIRAEKHINKGLLPFAKINPIKYFNDYQSRIFVLENDQEYQVVVWSGKNYYIITKFQKEIDADDAGNANNDNNFIASNANFGTTSIASNTNATPTPTDADKKTIIKMVFYDLWKYGYLLTDYGKYIHQDEFTYIPKNEIKSLLYITYENIMNLKENQLWKF